MSNASRRLRLGMNFVAILMLALLLSGCGVPTSIIGPTPTSTLTPLPTATATLVPTPTPVFSPGPEANLLISDPLRDNNQGHGWDTQYGPGGSCTLSSDGYHISAPANAGVTCLYYGGPTATPDVAVEVSMKILKGFGTIADSSAGLVLRGDKQAEGYYFGFDVHGRYSFNVIGANGSDMNDSKLGGFSPYFHTGYGVSNDIAFEARGDTLSAFVNGYLLGSVAHTTYQSGLLGMYAFPGPEDSGETVFSNIQVWSLP